MVAGDLMSKEVLTIYEDQQLAEILDLFLKEHIHGAPVLDRRDRLVGIVTQQDLFFATMTRSDGAVGPDSEAFQSLVVGDIMTSPAVSAGESTPIKNLCRMMHRLRIHRVPIVQDGRVTGLISSIDICGVLGRGASID